MWMQHAVTNNCSCNASTTAAKHDFRICQNLSKYHEISWNCILLPCQVPKLEVQTIYLYNIFGIWNGHFSSITKSSLGLSVKCTLTSPKRLSRLRLTPHYPWWDSGMVLEKIHKFCLFFPKWLAINGSHISRYGNILIYYDICIQVLLGGLNEDASVSGSIITSSVFWFCFGRGGSIMISYRNQTTRIVFEMLPGWYPHLQKQPELLIRLVQPFLSESKIRKHNKI